MYYFAVYNTEHPHLHSLGRPPFPPHPDPAIVVATDVTAVVPGPTAPPLGSGTPPAITSSKTLLFGVDRCAAAAGIDERGGDGGGGSGGSGSGSGSGCGGIGAASHETATLGLVVGEVAVAAAVASRAAPVGGAEVNLNRCRGTFFVAENRRQSIPAQAAAVA